MTEASQHPPLPDHLSIDVRSPHHVAAVFEHEIGIRFNDKERSDVQEYCISDGWIKVPAGKTLDRKGQPLLNENPRSKLRGIGHPKTKTRGSPQGAGTLPAVIKLKGKVEAFYR